jgi:hypothetical protein
MYRTIDVKTEVRKLASSKPVYAAAGAGLLASRALRELPARLARWRTEAPAGALPTSVTQLSSRATEYVHAARVRAVDGYDKLADHGKQVLAERGTANGRSALNGRAG